MTTSIAKRLLVSAKGLTGFAHRTGLSKALAELTMPVMGSELVYYQSEQDFHAAFPIIAGWIQNILAQHGTEAVPVASLGFNRLRGLIEGMPQ
jgi:hypothetical protein